MATDPAVTPSTIPVIPPSSGINTLFYPLDIGSTTDPFANGIFLDRPVIMFTCGGRDGVGPQYIGFPIPQGLEFSDGASYDDASLGYAGAALSGTIKTVQNSVDAQKLAGGVAGISTISGFKDAFKNSGSNDMASDIVAGMSMFGAGDNIKSSVGVSMKATVNRHIVTEFTGIGTRNFGFKFKLIASSKQESDIIRNICSSFRNGLYPDANMLALKYPPTWTIRFMMRGTDIEYLPKIWECYLTSLNVSYNGSGNLWHEDGSPIECDISVSFKETRALRHQDIRQLETTPFVKMTQSQRDGWKVTETEKIYNNMSAGEVNRRQSDTAQNTTKS